MARLRMSLARVGKMGTEAEQCSARIAIPGRGRSVYMVRANETSQRPEEIFYGRSVVSQRLPNPLLGTGRRSPSNIAIKE